ncbi:hypothetical protein H7X87_02640 [Acetobacteraceae bacterium]|nr:hypothetical protein [Candidatus Parcubacteria bacterium]
MLAIEESPLYQGGCAFDAGRDGASKDLCKAMSSHAKLGKNCEGCKSPYRRQGSLVEKLKALHPTLKGEEEEHDEKNFKENLPSVPVSIKPTSSVRITTSSRAVEKPATSLLRAAVARKDLDQKEISLVVPPARVETKVCSHPPVKTESRQEKTKRRYFEAGKRIHTSGKEFRISTFAKELGVSPAAVHHYFLRHPGFIDEMKKTVSVLPVTAAIESSEPLVTALSKKQKEVSVELEADLTLPLSASEVRLIQLFRQMGKGNQRQFLQIAPALTNKK